MALRVALSGSCCSSRLSRRSHCFRCSLCLFRSPLLGGHASTCPRLRPRVRGGRTRRRLLQGVLFVSIHRGTSSSCRGLLRRASSKYGRQGPHAQTDVRSCRYQQRLCPSMHVIATDNSTGESPNPVLWLGRAMPYTSGRLLGPDDTIPHWQTGRNQRPSMVNACSYL